MKLYIDPGTGSMLFAVLIGLIGALRYVVKVAIVKLRFITTSGKVKEENDKIPFAIFAESKRYWSIFKPIIEELNKKNFKVKYFTTSVDDPALTSGLENLEVEVLATTPGLDVLQWKRSKDVDYYIHIPHAASEVTQYRMFGIDYYDAILLSGTYQERDIRNLEKLRNIKEKDLYYVGIPYMDTMLERRKTIKEEKRKVPNVLLAPSWGDSAILKRFGEEFIQQLVDTGYNIIIRPHPQSFVSEKDMIDDLKQKFPDNEKLSWNQDTDNFNILSKSDILISDFSGVIFDYSLVFDKPVIYTQSQFDASPYDCWWLDYPLWTTTISPELGKEINENNFSKIKEIIDDCLNDNKYVLGRKKATEETWSYQGEGGKRAADFIINKYNELVKEGK